VNNKLLSKCKQISLVISDVDGVLTDGGMYYSEKGEVFKKFNTRDGMGIELLLKNNVKTVFITRERSKIVIARAKKVKAALTCLGVMRKELELVDICKKFCLKPVQIAYIGDDVNDVEIMKMVGFSAAPNDCVDEVKKIVDYVCSSKGGQGVLREIADLIISSRI
jgi:YrbI family 3-deoxy-D-manno-octulosonate 8-phosphate phosphatase